MPPAVQHELYPYNDPATCRSNRRGPRRRLAAYPPRAARAHALAARLAGDGRARDALSARQQRPAQQRRPTAASPASSMAAAARCASCRKSCSGVGGWRVSRRCTPRSRSATSTRATPPSPSSNGRGRYAALGLSLLGGFVGDARGQRVHHPYAGGGRVRPLSARAVRQIPARYLEGLPGGGRHRRCEELLALGRVGPDDDGEPFNMAYLAMRGSALSFGVSRLHGACQPADLPAAVPALAERRGAGRPRHQRRACADLGFAARRRVVDRSLRQGALARHARGVCRRLVSRPRATKQLWAMRGESRQALIQSVRMPAGAAARQPRASAGDRRTSRERARSERPDARLCAPLHRLQAARICCCATWRGCAPAERSSTPGAARRSPARRIRPTRRASDDPGLDRASRSSPAFRRRVVFLEDYDIALAQELVQGVDVWINTPRRPWEACGTSGMKVLVNGGLNLSALDGWWDEAYAAGLGWAIGDGESTLQRSAMQKTPKRCIRSSSMRSSRNFMLVMRQDCRGAGSSACDAAWPC